MSRRFRSIKESKDANLNKLNEEVLGFKAVAPANPSIGISDTTLNDSLMEVGVSGQTIDSMQFYQFRHLTDNRNIRYRIYDRMTEDPVIAAALDIYSDDVTQTNSKGQVIWATSDNPVITEAANRLLKLFKINENAWDDIQVLCRYGDLYYQTFKASDKISIDISDTNTYQKLNDSVEVTTEEVLKEEALSDEKKAELEKAQIIIDEETARKDKILKEIYNMDVGKVDDKDFKENVYTHLDKRPDIHLEEYIERYSDPAELYELTKKGLTVGFVKAKVVEVTPEANYFQNKYNYQMQDIQLYDPTKLIHIALGQSYLRQPITLSLTSDKEETDYVFKIKTGKSILQDVYKIHQELQLLNDALILNRVVKSAIIRIVQIDVGNKSPREIPFTMRKFKSLFEQKTAMNADAGTFSNYMSPGPVENTIFVPTRDGKGAVTSEILGGDPDIKSIVDIEYFEKKMYAALKIPKQYLGDTDDAAGFNGGSSLTKIDARYAHTIRRIQKTYISGITTILNLFFLDKGQESFIGNFKLCMQSPMTSEDVDRMEQLDNEATVIGKLFDLVSPEIEDPAVRLSIIRKLLNSIPYINDEVITIIDDYIESLKVPLSEIPEDEEEKEDLDTDEIPVSLGADRPRPSLDFDKERPEEPKKETDFPTDLSGYDIDLSDSDNVEKKISKETTVGEEDLEV